MDRPTEIIVVPHTHWDREWYEPFQRFRLRLVALLDEVFDRMAHDERQRFTLDGQLAAVDDYLEVRPERRDQVIALVRAGRLAVGPWQILLDEFLCSGENIVRNLERGLARSAALGGAMPVGYLPDMFGHIAQMPQLLAGAGLAHACVFRGVPDRVWSHAFAWQAPDGTTIRAEYLPGGYGNAAGLMDDPRLVTRRASTWPTGCAAGGPPATTPRSWRCTAPTTPRPRRTPPTCWPPPTSTGYACGSAPSPSTSPPNRPRWTACPSWRANCAHTPGPTSCPA
ncbi:hypothetical protein [Micromonospora sp. ATA51]|uniref:glycoside hydrolase family 38 N-terminal domain-containing protein n=1 Tax=Micromonospora sp. ATA51 TaxID=2806098 RepID=UPI001A43BD30|nr:hypothetical protein [Micromonospora sp. ATA51]MBM0227822.1 hypothetical protein [Micromonospora sp. ATA51]